MEARCETGPGNWLEFLAQEREDTEELKAGRHKGLGIASATGHSFQLRKRLCPVPMTIPGICFCN